MYFRNTKVYFQSTKVYSRSTKVYSPSTKVYFQSTSILSNYTSILSKNKSLLWKYKSILWRKNPKTRLLRVLFDSIDLLALFGVYAGIIFPLMQKLECVKQARKSIAKGCEIKQVNKHKKATLTSHARQALNQTHVLSCNWSKHVLTAIQTTRFDGSGPA